MNLAVAVGTEKQAKISDQSPRRWGEINIHGVLPMTMYNNIILRRSGFSMGLNLFVNLKNKNRRSPNSRYTENVEILIFYYDLNITN